MVIKRLLVMKVRALGDTLLATPALHALRRGFPEARITAVVSPQGRDVLEGNPDVDEVWVYDKKAPGRAGRYLDLAARLRSRKFDLGVALHASWRTAFLLWVSGAPRRVVHNHSGANHFGTISIAARKESKSAIERDLDAVRALNVAVGDTTLVFKPDAGDIQSVRAFLAEAGLGAGRYFVLIPGAGKARKRWSAASAAAFLERMQGAHAQAWVLSAGPEDRDLCAEISSRLKLPVPIFSGTLKEAGALYAQSLGVVATDSGPKHVAVAVGARTLTLWTDEPEAEWHPYAAEQHALLRSPTGVVSDLGPEAVIRAVLAHFPELKGN